MDREEMKNLNELRGRVDCSSDNSARSLVILIALGITFIIPAMVIYAIATAPH